MEQGLVAGAAAQDKGDVGDEEGTPHDEEEEEDDSQDLNREGEMKGTGKGEEGKWGKRRKKHESETEAKRKSMTGKKK